MATERKPNMAWEYSLSGWEEIVSPIQNEGGTCTEALLAHGYVRRGFTLGGDFVVGSVEVFNKQEPSSEGYEYFVWVEIEDGRCMDVFVPNFPSLCRLVHEVYPFVALQLMEQSSDWMESLAEKAFQAWHGHGAIGICRECDPLRYEGMQQRRMQK